MAVDVKLQDRNGNELNAGKIYHHHIRLCDTNNPDVSIYLNFDDTKNNQYNTKDIYNLGVRNTISFVSNEGGAPDDFVCYISISKNGDLFGTGTALTPDNDEPYIFFDIPFNNIEILEHTIL